jgi:ABC-type Na+ efflux pump permease subunit
MNNAQKAIIGKDIKEIIGNKEIFIPMIIVPIVFMVIMPLGLLILSNYGDFTAKNLNELKFINDLPFIKGGYSIQQILILVALEYIFPSFFMIIPIMNSSIIGASSFVGEKEHKTLETLLYAPISVNELFTAKVVGVFLPAYISAFVACLLFGIVMNVGGYIYFSRLIFPSIKWFLIIFWLTPAITLGGIIFTVLISAKAKTFQSAQQMSGLIVLPIILILVGQINGLFLLSNKIVIIVGLVLFIIDFILIRKTAKGFSPEKLI